MYYALTIQDLVLVLFWALLFMFTIYYFLLLEKDIMS